ncbi:MAG: hypothetical protein HY042_01210 [Spirochaetia bacterium]|nr:hypothetical protein [Spirochaetia bacterium]
MELKELETRFEKLREITDRVALMNTVYDSDITSAFDGMEGFMAEAMTWDLHSFGADARRAYLSHMSFHREIVADTIAEARRLLLPERREYLKRLVSYHKNFIKWFGKLERQYAA